jgi:hypothetical protein
MGWQGSVEMWEGRSLDLLAEREQRAHVISRQRRLSDLPADCGINSVISAT